MKNVVDKAVRNYMNNERLGPKGKKTIKGQHDDELIKLLESNKAKIRVIGIGGGGCNTVDRMSEVGIHGAETFVVNTDAQDLIAVTADEKMLIGKELTRGLGSGSNPSVGEAAAQESLDELQELLVDSDLVFITCGLGGGTGTGASPIIAEIAKETKALVIAVVTLPFTVEGKKRMENAMEGLTKLKKAADTIIVIPNDKILEIAPDLPVAAAFKVADEVLTNAVKGITEMVTKPGLINLDFADLRTILERGGAAMIGLGESHQEKMSDSRALEAVENAGVFAGYLEDLVYTPKTMKAIKSVQAGALGKVLWARSRETHPGPHSDWFWDKEHFLVLANYSNHWRLKLYMIALL